MKITWQSLGQRCEGTTRKGAKCRLPASEIVGGIASCPYHINQILRLFRDVQDRLPDDIKNAAIRDSSIY